MKSEAHARLRLGAEGLVLFALRWAQLKTGFDPATGLSRQNLPGTILVAAIFLLAAAEIYFALKLPKGKFSYQNAFAPIENGQMVFLAAGSLLLGIGGLLLPGWELLKILTAAAGIATTIGCVLFVKLLRGGEPRTYALLPSMIFAVLLVLVVYLPQESNPVLARYYLQVLAAALTACAFYQLAGFPCREASVRWFSLFGNLAAPLCVACWADCWEDLGLTMIYGGCALVLMFFLTMRLSEPVPEPEKPKENDVQTEAGQN